MWLKPALPMINSTVWLWWALLSELVKYLLCSCGLFWACLYFLLLPPFALLLRPCRRNTPCSCNVCAAGSSQLSCPSPQLHHDSEGYSAVFGAATGFCMQIADIQGPVGFLVMILTQAFPGMFPEQDEHRNYQLGNTNVTYHHGKVCVPYQQQILCR